MHVVYYTNFQQRLIINNGSKNFILCRIKKKSILLWTDTYILFYFWKFLEWENSPRKRNFLELLEHLQYLSFYHTKLWVK
jgi:hypothetical protein